ncbi:c-type cytochrome [Zoogloea sp. LCSB751]|uniref:c-type cytochrome n=1 Tax=Zoogloea sp. LCSB751 TaxID=1965277 RepID=UPI0009A4774A|nr:c-type cytochrome [Zoogloea sp. LCSB751]
MFFNVKKAGLGVLAGTILVPAALAGGSNPALIKRGAELVAVAGCGDCHTPFKMGAHGPEKDVARGLSGHPEDLALPPPPQLAAAWNWAGSASMTAFVGPWGITYSPNLTPDKETGLGAVSEKAFIHSLRTGQHLDGKRPILPPMPWQALGKLSDKDLKAIFAYLQAQPAVRNKVPEYQPPAGALTKIE